MPERETESERDAMQTIFFGPSPEHYLKTHMLHVTGVTDVPGDGM